MRSGYGALGYLNAWIGLLLDASRAMFIVAVVALAYVMTRTRTADKVDREAVTAANRMLESVALVKVSLPPLLTLQR